MRDGNRNVLLKSILVDVLKKRRFEYKGRFYPLSANGIDQIVRELSTPGLHEGLLSANQRIYDKLVLGITVTEFMPDGKKHYATIPIVDWNDPTGTNNRYHVTEELELMRSDGILTRRPDIVCYVNGIPLIVIEAKRPDSKNPNTSMVDEGVSQHLRNQRPDEIPLLFAYGQLLLAISETDGRYGTTKTPAKFWARWRDEEFDEAYFTKIKNTQLGTETKDAIFQNKPRKVREYFENQWASPMLPTEQDRLIVSLLNKARVLEGSSLLRRGTRSAITHQKIKNMSMETNIQFEPKWKELLECTMDGHKFTVEITMGTLAVYFPTQSKWESQAPEWAKNCWYRVKDDLSDWCKQQRIPMNIQEDAWVDFD